MDIPALISPAMARKGLTQAALGDRLGVGQGAVQKWLARERRPDPEHWTNIATALDLTYDEVAAAYGRTALERSGTIRQQLVVAQERIVELEAEVRRLTERLRAER